MGSRVAFALGMLVIIVWLSFGRTYTTWAQVIDPIMATMTYLALFLVSNTQRHQEKAVHAKLDEIIHAIKDADNKLIHVEESDEVPKKEYD